MNYYELIAILPAQYTDAEIPGVVGELKKTIEKSGAEVRELREVSKSRLAYPVKHIRHGHYIYGELAAEPKLTAALNRELGLFSPVMRHSLVRLSEREIGKQKTVSLAAITSPVMTAEGERRRPIIKQPIVPVAAPATAAEKMTMEELDKKLEQILTEDIK